MNTARLKLLDCAPAVNVAEDEYYRLLGYPRGHEPGERPRELEAWVRDWYAEHGQPWIYLREAELSPDQDSLRLDGVEFCSSRLCEQLRRAGARRVMLAAVSAGRECEEHARSLWQDGKPDEYFFLEMFGSAVVEQLVTSLNGRICALADSGGFAAIPHYSPGYAGWDVAEQNKLFELIAGRAGRPFPGPLEVLPSGMLSPKKSLLAVVGLVPRASPAAKVLAQVPCVGCPLSPCGYRRAPYRPAPGRGDAASRLAAGAREPGYTIPTRALQKWSRERVVIERRSDGSIDARFRFDGTTCSNLGQPLAFDYRVALGSPADGYPVLEADCRPAEGDDGYQSMCAYLTDADALMAAIAREKPLVGRPLDEVFGGTAAGAPSGCHCTADSRAHKWSLAFQAIHFALAQNEGDALRAPDSP